MARAPQVFQSAFLRIEPQPSEILRTAAIPQTENIY
jgi:hypothetical protein